jgi:hypothetical protein
MRVPKSVTLRKLNFGVMLACEHPRRRPGGRDRANRLSNLQAGALDMIERVAPSDVLAIQRDSRLALHVYNSLGSDTEQTLPSPG